MPKVERMAGDDWIELRKLDDWYTYAHEVRTGGFFVAILGYDSSRPHQILMRYEEVPPHQNGIQPVAFTGGVEIGKTEEAPDKSLADAAVREFYEEAGYALKVESMIPLGVVRVSKGADTVHALFAADLKGMVQGDAVGDGTQGEKSAYSKWEPIKNAVNSEDAVLMSLLLRAQALGLVKVV